MLMSEDRLHFYVAHLFLTITLISLQIAEEIMSSVVLNVSMCISNVGIY